MELNETERAVLYCWINNNGLIDTSGLREDDFSSKTLKCAYGAGRYAEYESRLIERRNRLQAGFRGADPLGQPLPARMIFSASNKLPAWEGVGSWLPAGTCFRG